MRAISLHNRFHNLLIPCIKFLRFFRKQELVVISDKRTRGKEKSIIYAYTHIGGNDLECVFEAIKSPCFLFLGDPRETYVNLDGLMLYLNGVICLDSYDKEDRYIAKQTAISLLKQGGSLMIYPEGTWNKSPNELVSGLFPGIYDVAKKSGALVVPIATYRNGKKAYGITEKAFDICQYDREQGIQILRDKMATMQYELMEKYGTCSRDKFPYGEKADKYWNDFIDELMAEVKFYDYEVELNTKYHPRGVTSPKEAFAFMEDLVPNKNNIFLFGK